MSAAVPLLLRPFSLPRPPPSRLSFPPPPAPLALRRCSPAQTRYFFLFYFFFILPLMCLFDVLLGLGFCPSGSCGMGSRGHGCGGEGCDHLAGLYRHANLPHTDVKHAILLGRGTAQKMKDSSEAPKFRFGWFKRTVTQPGLIFPKSPSIARPPPPPPTTETNHEVNQPLKSRAAGTQGVAEIWRGSLPWGVPVWDRSQTGDTGVDEEPGNALAHLYTS